MKEEEDRTLIQSLWLETSLAERPISFTPRLSNSPWFTEAAPSSVVQTAGGREGKVSSCWKMKAVLFLRVKSSCFGKRQWERFRDQHCFAKIDAATYRVREKDDP